jgi:hypothetical protein
MPPKMHWAFVSIVATLGVFGASASLVSSFDDSSLAGVIVEQRRIALKPNVSWTDANLGQLGRRQEDSRCGPANANQRCPGALCCSSYGYCGDSAEHCNQLGCRPEFGWCEGQPLPTSTAVPPPPLPTTNPASTAPTSATVVTATPLPPAPGGLTITSNGMCGNGTTCEGAAGFGRCCSFYYWCGSGDSYCGDRCRPEFGWCEGEPEPSPTASTSTSTIAATSSPLPPGGLKITSNGMCGNGTTCSGSGFGECCSFYYWCGNGADYCGDRCRAGFGRCGEEQLPSSSTSRTTSTVSSTSTTPARNPTTTSTTSTISTTSTSSAVVSIPTTSTTTSSSTFTRSSTSASPTVVTPLPPPGFVITTNGVCGNTTTCAGSVYGNCCSHFYWCGNSADYCGEGCRSQFGECQTTTPSVPEPPRMPVSVNGMCGNGTTCDGSGFGSCCSRYYYCGTTDAYCGENCRPEFGSCT